MKYFRHLILWLIRRPYRNSMPTCEKFALTVLLSSRYRVVKLSHGEDGDRVSEDTDTLTQTLTFDRELFEHIRNAILRHTRIKPPSHEDGTPVRVLPVDFAVYGGKFGDIRHWILSSDDLCNELSLARACLESFGDNGAC